MKKKSFYIYQIIRGKASKSRTLATWATKEIRKLKNASWYVTYDADSLPSLTNSQQRSL
jgi:ribosomal protein L35